MSWSKEEDSQTDAPVVDSSDEEIKGMSEALVARASDMNFPDELKKHLQCLHAVAHPDQHSDTDILESTAALRNPLNPLNRACVKAA